MAVRQKINIVWLKRDLRTQDHLPLHAAEIMDIPYLIIYCFEPSIYTYKDTSTRHLQFVYHSIKALNTTLATHNLQVHILHCEAEEAFDFLADKFDVQAVFSHQESGTEHTWRRDKAVNKRLRSKKIEWREYQKDCVIRGIDNRLGWDTEWLTTMGRATLKNTYKTHIKITVEHPFLMPPELENQLKKYPAHYQPPGETNAWRYLRSFTEKRGKNYFKHISKPTESRVSCARISPYLAWGNLSVKQAYHYVNSHPNYKLNKRAFDAFLIRLQWHCHCVQKFETECAYETLCVNRGYETLKHEGDMKLVEAWKTGKTGFPLVDACMRCVAETGWINFRMRAMVVSILCHHLDLDWRLGVYHLAQQFLDYDPGIHYPQFQMQAGTTGTNLVRMYNPVKQSMDHDPEGAFIKKWVPELQDVPTAFIHEPWKMTPIDETFCGVTIGKDYPAPIVDMEESARVAREKIWGHRKFDKVKTEQKRILKTHVRPTK